MNPFLIRVLALLLLVAPSASIFLLRRWLEPIARKLSRALGPIASLFPKLAFEMTPQILAANAFALLAGIPGLSLTMIFGLSEGRSEPSELQIYIGLGAALGTLLGWVFAYALVRRADSAMGTPSSENPHGLV